MSLASYLDFTLLDPDAPPSRIETHCETAAKHAVFAVCLLPFHIKRAQEVLSVCDTRLASVVGFPAGDHSLNSKLHQAERLVLAGVDEIDFVINRPAVSAGAWDIVEAETQALAQLTSNAGVILKMIVECGCRTQEQLVRLCQMAIWYDIDFVKTSTGTAKVGARVEDVVFLRKLLPESIQIKASGGIRTAAAAQEMIAAGATRIGTSQLLVESI